jgi:N-hydroxyarylamine O-acetyltransferase
LVDVGFGDSFLEPLLLDGTGAQAQDQHAYKIVPVGSRRNLLWCDDDSDWKAQYSFGLEPYEYADFAERCRYHQTSPQSHFTQGRICSLPTADGRVTLSEMRFIQTFNNGSRQEKILTTQEEYSAALHQYFGIELD